MQKLTKKEKGFADKYLDIGNGTQAVLQSPYNASNLNSAGVEAYRTLRKAKVQEYIESHAENAESMIYKLSQTGKQEPVRLGASKDIMDRAGFKPIERSESKAIRVNIDTKIENKELEALRVRYEEELRVKLLL